MKKTHILSVLAAGVTALLASTASAQISPAFPSGIDLFHAPEHALNIPRYSGALGSYYFASNANVPSDISSATNGWTSSPLNLTTAFGSNPWSITGGTVKAIYLGETAGWTDDFGYVSSASPSIHVPLITDIVGQGNVFSGWETYVSYAAGTTLDFFLNSGGQSGQGGLFYAFGSPNEYAGSDKSSHVRWKIVDVNTTYLDENNVLTTGLVKTLLVGFEDTRKGISFYDADFNDFVVGFQFLPSQLVAVPEPATYGLIGALALCGLIGYRRFKASKAARQSIAA